VKPYGKRTKGRPASIPRPCNEWRSFPAADMQIDGRREESQSCASITSAHRTAGGQHVNKTESASAFHPTCDRDRGRVPGLALQHKNRGEGVDVWRRAFRDKQLREAAGQDASNAPAPDR